METNLHRLLPWVHHLEPESKQESMQSLKKGTPPPKEFKVSESAGKSMATVFWNCKEIILIDYKEKEGLESEYTTQRY